jgi:DNA-binding response OmpR family regulator
MSNVGRRILLVDDDEQFVGLLDIRLTKAGYAVTPVSNAELAFHLALTGEHDVIVLDVVMPRMSGVELCAALRAQGILTPILVLSGQTEKDIVVQARASARCCAATAGRSRRKSLNATA